MRELKTAKAEKSVVAAAVAQLLDLKQQLAAAQGLPLATAAVPDKKSKKKK